MREETRNTLAAASVADADIQRLTELDAPAADDLATLLKAAQTHQARELKEAMDGMLDAMPRLLRGPVKKLFER